MKIEALGHNILKGSANSTCTPSDSTKKKNLLQLNFVNGILWDNSTLPFSFSIEFRSDVAEGKMLQ